MINDFFNNIDWIIRRFVKENRPPPVNRPVACSLRSGRFPDPAYSNAYIIVCKSLMNTLVE